MELIEAETNECVFWEPEWTAEVNERFDLALEVHDSGDHESAKDLLRMLVMWCPNHIDAVHHLSLDSWRTIRSSRSR